MSYERKCPADYVNRVFGMRVREARTARGWSARELARKTELSPSTITRIEAAHATFLAYAVAVAEALGVPLAALLEPVSCARCLDHPPAGFTCRSCGSEGEEPAS